MASKYTGKLTKAALKVPEVKTSESEDTDLPEVVFTEGKTKEELVAALDEIATPDDEEVAEISAKVRKFRAKIYDLPEPFTGRKFSTKTVIPVERPSSWLLAQVQAKLIEEVKE